MNTPKVIEDAARWASVRLLATDVDGTLTDGGLSFDADGKESKRFHVRDGYGLVMLQAAGIPVVWISGRASEVTRIRAAELRTAHLLQPVSDKVAALTGLIARLGLQPSEICYIGDDTNDLGALEFCGLACAPADAHPKVLAAAQHITRDRGGQGAVRELCDRILAARGHPS